MSFHIATSEKKSLSEYLMDNAELVSGRRVPNCICVLKMKDNPLQVRVSGSSEDQVHCAYDCHIILSKVKCECSCGHNTAMVKSSAFTAARAGGDREERNLIPFHL